MTDARTYTLWVQPQDATADLTDGLDAIAEVRGASAVPLAAAGITKKEAMVAITLSVTANFATDGLKAVIAHLEQDEAAKVVLCRRPDGSDHDLGPLRAPPDMAP